ncbi:MAG TPA: metal-dependent hydrolase [Bryobacteraceae bacterium]|nr:metal-dependent hydrolase [Bryobacteraceae bacterium]
MDPVTHALTGLAMSRAGLSRWHAQAPALLMLAAEAPDVDIVSAFNGSYSYFVHHRWITHAFVAAPVLAILVSLLFCTVRPSWKRFGAGFLLALLGVLSHLVLDWTNAYGIRFLLPFDSHWYSLDLVNVVDPWILLVLIIAAVGPLLGRLVSSEMGARASAGRGLAISALVFFCIYDGGRGLLHQRALDVLESRVYDGAAPVRAAAIPTLLNPLAWDGIVETRRSMKKFQLNLSAAFDPEGGRTWEKPEASAALAAAARTEMFRQFLGFSKYPLWSVVPAPGDEDSTEVTVTDLRFGFHVSAIVNSGGRVQQTRFAYR